MILKNGEEGVFEYFSYFSKNLIITISFAVCLSAGGTIMILHTKLGFLITCLLTAVLPTFLSLGGGFSLLNAACSVPSDACWESGFHQPGVSGTVYAMVRDNSGNIYVGGEINTAGGVTVNNLAMWDGTTWRDMGGGVTIASGTARVSALAVDTNNNLIVGGYFDQAGGTAANNLAVWNGTGWQELGGGVNGSVMAIKVISGSLNVGGGMYVGGSFSQVGTVAANNIAYFNFQPGSWLTLGGGVDDTVNVIELETTSNSLFVGGDFSAAGETPAYRIARYDRTLIWHGVGGGLMSLGGEIKALLAVGRVSGGYDLYVGGAFAQVGSVAPTTSPAGMAPPGMPWITGQTARSGRSCVLRQMNWSWAVIFPLPGPL